MKPRFLSRSKAWLGAALGAAVLTCGAVSVIAPTAAQASEGSGACSSSDGANGADECLYYHANFKGACFADPIKDAYTGWTFATCTTNPVGDPAPGNASGAGQPVRNDAASAQNWSHGNTCFIWVFANWTGPNQSDPPFTAINLNSSLVNNNASQSWG